jgi:cobalt-zinc-cadmium efflux system membrane fusion protein
MCAVWVLSLAGACSRSSAGVAEKPAPQVEHEASEDHAHQHDALPRRVRLSAAVLAQAGLQTSAVTREQLAVTVSLPGEIVADPDRSAHVASPVSGRIEQVSFREGSVVKKGDLLAVIRVPELGKVRSTHTATLARAKAARANAARLERLVNARLASDQLYLDALAQAEALEVEARAASDQLTALGLSGAETAPSSLILRAPLSGVVLSRNAVVGQPIAPDTEIAAIVDLSEVWFLGRVFEKDLGRLKPSAKAEVLLNAYPKQTFQGTVEYLGQKVDSVARTVTARVRLTNRDDLLRVGLFGTARVSTEEATGKLAALVVPRGALSEVAGKDVVFVRRAERDFELHDVVLGESAAGKVEVLSGLREGEQVVTEGVFTLKSAVLKATFAEED